ncbi:MAG: hypothetical protein RID07_10330, partial [Lacipirellulaceae bacterium]
LANTQTNEAWLLLDAGDNQAALRPLEKAEQALIDLVEQFPDVPLYAVDLAHAERTLGEVLIELGRDDEGIKKLESSRDRFAELVRQHPADRDYGEQLRETQEVLRGVREGNGENTNEESTEKESEP